MIWFSIGLNVVCIGLTSLVWRNLTITQKILIGVIEKLALERDRLEEAKANETAEKIMRAYAPSKPPPPDFEKNRRQ